MSIDLTKHQSYCEIQQRTIVSRDTKSPCKHIAQNTTHNDVRQYHIDGDVISKGESEKCDWLVLNDTKRKAYLIELKGSDIHKASRQLDATYQLLGPVLRGYEFLFRIIYRTGTQRTQDSATVRWKEKCRKMKIEPVISRMQYEEQIS